MAKRGRPSRKFYVVHRHERGQGSDVKAVFLATPEGKKAADAYAATFQTNHVDLMSVDLVNEGPEEE